MADKDTVSFPEQEDYLKRIQAAKSGGAPVGGVPMPKIPMLDGSGPRPNTGIIPPDQVAEMQRSGNFIPGVGSGYSANQPAMRQAQPAAPISGVVNPPRPEGAGLRPETVQQLEAVARANDPALAVKPDEDKIKEEIDKLDEEFDFDEFGNRIHSLLQNKVRREAIEARCSPMNFDDLLKYQEIRQNVPIIPKRFEVTYRSSSGHEDLFIKRKMSGEKGSDAYLRDKLAVLGLAVGLYALNGQELPPHLDKDGRIDDKLFEIKLERILKFPFDLIIDMSVNYGWFGRRLQKLLVVDNLKGF